MEKKMALSERIVVVNGVEYAPRIYFYTRAKRDGLPKTRINDKEPFELLDFILVGRYKMHKVSDYDAYLVNLKKHQKSRKRVGGKRAVSTKRMSERLNALENRVKRLEYLLEEREEACKYWERLNVF